MTQKIEDTGVDELAGRDNHPAEPGHNAWFRSEVRATLDKKAVGEMAYRSLDEVIASFGFDDRPS